MSDHDTIPSEVDDEMRARLEALAGIAVEHVDTEAALGRMPRDSLPPTKRLLAIAACLLLVVGLAAVVLADRRSVDTTDPLGPPQTIDSPTTLARGVVEFVKAPEPPGCCAIGSGFLSLPAGGGLDGQTLDITAERKDGRVTGEARFGFLGFGGQGRADLVVELECAKTSTEDVVLAGTVTTRLGDGEDIPAVGMVVAVIIREGAPDSATIGWDERVSSCSEALASVPDNPPDDAFLDVVEGDDIETGG